jgi:hypothetical protein
MIAKVMKDEGVKSKVFPKSYSHASRRTCLGDSSPLNLHLTFRNLGMATPIRYT